MNQQTRRLLKVYLRLGWLKLHAYYEKLTSIAYAGSIVINPYRKLPFLTRLWQQIPNSQATSYFNDCKTRLRDLWKMHYKNRELKNGILANSANTAHYRDYTSLQMQFRNSLGSNNQLQNSGRRRRYRVPPQIEDELDKYLSEPKIPKNLYNGDPISWWRKVGAGRFPTLCFLAANLLSIPSSTAAIERRFNTAGSMITPKRNRLRAYIVNQAQCLSDWRRSGYYVATEDWQRVIPVEKA
jgi:hypothetical protein